jgi:peptidoglycan/LPS O-acetylase OafA/YrhL
MIASALGRTDPHDDFPAEPMRLDQLDSLRGLAALAVVFGHCLDVLPAFGTKPYSGPRTWLWVVLKQSPLEVLRDGHAAVLVFFVLSGLVLSMPFLQGRAPAYRVFVIKRVLRLYPPYASALLLAAVLQTAFAARLPRGLSDWLTHANWAEPLTAQAALDYALMLGGRISLDNPVWSLDYEMRVSLVLPLLLLPMLRWGAAGAIGTGVAMLSVGGFLLNLGSPGIPQAVGQTCLYGAMFMLGALLARRTGRLQALRLPSLSLWLLLLAWVIFYVCWRDTMLAAGAAALIAAVLVPGPAQRLCGLAPARFLGRISYSLYLIHVPVLLTLLSALHGILPVPVILLLCPPAAILAGVAFHTIVEAPSHTLSRLVGRRRLLPAN